MATKEMKAYECLPDDVKPAILALSVLIDRLKALPKEDRDDMFELVQIWHNSSDPEEQRSARQAMEEILAQIPLKIKPMPLVKSIMSGRDNWARHVGMRIRELREKAGLTQTQLARKADLPQSHISRLENAEHSATHLTLEKIAKALGVSVRKIDPVLD